MESLEMIKKFILDVLDFMFSKYWWERSITRDFIEDEILQKYEKKQHGRRTEGAEDGSGGL